MAEQLSQNSKRESSFPKALTEQTHLASADCFHWLESDVIRLQQSVTLYCGSSHNNIQYVTTTTGNTLHSWNYRPFMLWFKTNVHVWVLENSTNETATQFHAWQNMIILKYNIKPVTSDLLFVLKYTNTFWKYNICFNNFQLFFFFSPAIQSMLITGLKSRKLLSKMLCQQNCVFLSWNSLTVIPHFLNELWEYTQTPER